MAELISFVLKPEHRWQRQKILNYVETFLKTAQGYEFYSDQEILWLKISDKVDCRVSDRPANTRFLSGPSSPFFGPLRSIENRLSHRIWMQNSCWGQEQDFIVTRNQLRSFWQLASTANLSGPEQEPGDASKHRLPEKEPCCDKGR